jgi:hypothetical protein
VPRGARHRDVARSEGMTSDSDKPTPISRSRREPLEDAVAMQAFGCWAAVPRHALHEPAPAAGAPGHRGHHPRRRVYSRTARWPSATAATAAEARGGSGANRRNISTSSAARPTARTRPPKSSRPRCSWPFAWSGLNHRALGARQWPPTSFVGRPLRSCCPLLPLTRPSRL